MHRLSFTRSVALLLAAGLAGCASGSDDTLGFDEFVAQAYHEPDTGVYVVNGDEIAEDLAQMRDLYQRYLDSEAKADSNVGTVDQPLIINTVNGQWDRWSADQALNLTYCVSSARHGGFTASQYAAVVAALDSATQEWEGTARVNFVHVASSDASCNARTGVVFDVRPVCSGQYLARSFFPSSKRRSREILVDCTSFGNISPWSLAGVMRHELGHTIGFRHEHTRPESGTCFEDNNWAALTAYDSASVMHYPQCNGTQNGDLVLTSLDRNGARVAYP